MYDLSRLCVLDIAPPLTHTTRTHPASRNEAPMSHFSRSRDRSGYPLALRYSNVDLSLDDPQLVFGVVDEEAGALLGVAD